MNLEEKVNEQLKSAMKSGDKLRTETLRMLRAAIIEFLKSGTNKALEGDAELQLVRTAAKRRRDAIEEYRRANRPDLAEKEERELEIINEFMPPQMGESEIDAVLEGLAAGLPVKAPSDLGKLMGLAMKELKGKADGTLVQQRAKMLVERVTSGQP